MLKERRKKQNWADEKSNCNAGSTKPANQAEKGWVQTATPLYACLAQLLDVAAPEGHGLGWGSSLQLLKELTTGSHLPTTLPQQTLPWKEDLSCASPCLPHWVKTQGPLCDHHCYRGHPRIPQPNIFISGRWDPIEQQKGISFRRLHWEIPEMPRVGIGSPSTVLLLGSEAPARFCCFPKRADVM